MPKKENISHISVRNSTLRPSGWPRKRRSRAGAWAEVMGAGPPEGSCGYGARAAPDPVGAPDVPVAVAYPGLAVGTDEHRAVQVDHRAQRAEHESRPHRQRRAAHVADHQ